MHVQLTLDNFETLVYFRTNGFVKKFMSDKNNKNILYCSFCGKSQHEVRKLIAGPTVFICDECVELCMDIIKEENKDVFVKNQEGVPTPEEICKVLRRLCNRSDLC